VKRCKDIGEKLDLHTDDFPEFEILGMVFFEAIIIHVTSR